MNLPDSILLCGFMGAGKSTLGRRLAEKINRSFLDLDEQIVDRAGKPIPQIFADSGEGRFRKLERETLLEILRTYKGVVALGGGSLQNQHLLDHLKLNGLLVFVKTPLSIIVDRISKDKNRPMLLDSDGKPKQKEKLRKDLEVLYADRLPFYEQAEITLEVSTDQSVEEQIETLITRIYQHVA